MEKQELLELSSKAVGGEVATGRWNGARLHIYTGKKSYTWDPLDYNGDALWLAAQLRLLIHPGKNKGDGCSVYPQSHVAIGCTAFHDDADQAMRNAIVRVAAEIGKSV